MHVARVRSSHTARDGQRRDYMSAYLRRSYRDGAAVKNETLANLSGLPGATIDSIEAALNGTPLVPAGTAVSITSSLPHGHVAAVHAMAVKLGLPGLLGPACRERDLAVAMIVSRVVRPRSKLSTLSWWGDVTLGADLGVAGASTDEMYQAMDWLVSRQDRVEKKLAARHLAAGANPSRMALFDLSSSWMEGSHCPLAARGYSRDGKKNRAQIEYGLLTDPEGRPVAIRVFPGSTGDPTAFTAIVKVIRTSFGLEKMILVGDRGMITTARITALNKPDQPPPQEPPPAGRRRAGTDDQDAEPELPGGTYGWITSLRAPAIAKLIGEDGPLQMSLFDEQNLAEISSPDFPGERLIACRNPVLAAERARKRENLLAATEKALAPIISRVAAGRLTGADAIGLKAGEVIGKYKVAKHFQVTITDTTLTVTRQAARIEAEAALDGFYVIRTPEPAGTLPAAAAVTAYKNLKYVERDFRIIKADDLDLRPVFHRLEDRVKAHVLICMLACYLTWHLRRAWAPLTYTDTEPPAPADPVAPAARSAAATAKAAAKTGPDGQPARSFRDLIDHLAILTRNQVRFAGTQVTIAILADPTPTQRRAFELLDTPVPIELK